MMRDPQALASLANAFDDDDALDPRRSAQRWPVHAEIESIVPAGVSGIVLNVSVGGLRVALDRVLPLGEVCVLRVRHEPGSETIEHARVVWVKPRPDGCIVGLEFVTAH
jgi:hypothetical protein